MAAVKIQLDSKLGDLETLSDKQRKGLTSLGLETTGDLLLHFPRRYEDRTKFDQFPRGPMSSPVCIHGEVTDSGVKRFGPRRGQGYFEIKLEGAEADALSSPIYCRWFNMPFLNKVIAVGHELVVYGQPKIVGKKLTIAHPDYEIVEPSNDAGIHMDRIVPVYPAASGVTQRLLRGMAFRVVSGLDDEDAGQVLPRELLPDMERAEALRQIHFPGSWEEMQRAREYLATEEFTTVQLEVLRRKAAQSARPGQAHCGEGLLLKDMLNGLPFPLTGAQKRCIDEIRRDLASDAPMNRLLQGDVGAGKTLVAFAAMLLAVEAGFQAALMAPTQILAEQHFLNFRRYAEKLDLRISLRTGSRKEDSFVGGMFGGDEPQIVIGTHALIHDGVQFENLGLAVIDEQHKFGVAQRSRLIEQGMNPDVLVMTATPIPRTLTMTVYGDLDVSLLDELPAGRGKIVTGVRPTTKTEQAAKFLREQLEEGRQAYIVYPLIDESDKRKSQAATREFEKWRERLSEFETGLLHGRIPPEEKEMLMGQFRDGKLDVLVATTVIEVGVDVPNANLMLIYNAENFGLAQLHQLRGRIGRGEHKSYCVLMCDPKADEAMERLKILEETRDGFLIAEEDLKLRGPGDVLGTMQSGMPNLRFASLLADTELVKRARDLAASIVDRDPHLELPEHRTLRLILQRRKAATADEKPAALVG